MRSCVRFTRSLLLLLYLPSLSVGGDRLPAVAGQFYPRDPGELRMTVQALLSHAAAPRHGDQPLALIVPHAGYQYSGSVAASGFNQLNAGSRVERVVLLGSSHRTAFSGGAVYTSGDFLTPLGRVTVDRDAGNRLVAGCPALIMNDAAHAGEHSLEVQLPFLQTVLGTSFRLIPILIGTDDHDEIRAIARALRPYRGKHTLFVISTDLSHYPPATTAQKVDRKTIAAVCTGSPRSLVNALRENGEARVPGLVTRMCGSSAVLTLLYMIEGDPADTVELVRYAHSGDVSGGDVNHVVGYAALTVRRSAPSGFSVPPEDQRTLLGIARSSVAAIVATRSGAPDPEIPVSPRLKEPGSAFVSLYCGHRLRGCIGSFARTAPLDVVVRQMARAAATEDPRFPPVQPGELRDLRIEISVLSPLQRIRGARDIALGKHGIYVRKGDRAGTFLPQVAIETGWTVEEFLGHCAADKAGIGWDGWRSADLFVFEACVFGERDIRAPGETGVKTE